MTSQLPTTLGPVEFTPTNVRLWCIEPRRFAPILHFEPPQAEQPDMPTGPQTISPQPSTSFIPKEYQVHLHSSFCSSCGQGNEWSYTYALESRPARMGAGAAVHHLQLVDRFSYNIPLRTIRAPLKTIPTCHECTNLTKLDHLPTPPTPAELKAPLHNGQTAIAAALVKASTKKPAATPRRSINDFF